MTALSWWYILILVFSEWWHILIVYRYTGRSTAALKCFNMARKDTVWGNRAIFNMVEICLNPDSDTIGGEVFESVEGQTGWDIFPFSHWGDQF